MEQSYKTTGSMKKQTDFLKIPLQILVTISKGFLQNINFLRFSRDFGNNNSSPEITTK